LITINEIQEGESYACKFKVEHMLDSEGNLSDGEGSIFELGTYEGLGIIRVRDMKSQLVELQDEKTKKTFVVPFNDIWDIDTVEWVDDND